MLHTVRSPGRFKVELQAVSTNVHCSSVWLSEEYICATLTVRFKWEANLMLSCGSSSLCSRRTMQHLQFPKQLSLTATRQTITLTLMSQMTLWQLTACLLKFLEHGIPKQGKTVYRKLLMNITDLFTLNFKQDRRIHMTNLPLLYI